MNASREETSSARPVERFKPTSGILVGYAGMLFVAVTVGYVALRVHTVTGLQVALGVLFFGVLIWMTQLRSRATAYADRLLLKNTVRDAVIPLLAIEEVSVRQTLNVWVGERRYVCIGIGQSMRSMVKGRKSGSSMLGQGRWREFSDKAERAAPDQTAMSYEVFVVTRIEELVEQAKKEARKLGATRRNAAAPPVRLARARRPGRHRRVRSSPASSSERRDRYDGHGDYSETRCLGQVGAHRVEAAHRGDPRCVDVLIDGHHDLEVTLDLRLGSRRTHHHPGVLGQPVTQPVGGWQVRRCPRRGRRPARP